MSFNEIKIFNWFFVADKLTIKIKKFYAYKTVNQIKKLFHLKSSDVFILLKNVKWKIWAMDA